MNYPAHKREFLALKWAMTDKFHDYILGSKVTVVTDNNPLCYILKNAKLDATSHRWLAALSVYDFDLKYKRGPTHVDADGLSRRPQAPPEEDEEYKESLGKMKFLLDRAQRFENQITISQPAINAIMTAKGVKSSVVSLSHGLTEPHRLPDPPLTSQDQQDVIPAAEAVIKDPLAIPDDILNPDPSGRSSTQQAVSEQEWRRLQRADPNIAVVMDCLEQGRTIGKAVNSELKVYSRETKRLTLKSGVLYRRTEHNGSQRLQLVVPKSYRKVAMKGVHEDLFHTHFEDAIQQARMRFFWPFMSPDLEKKIKRCERCVRRGAAAQRAPMSTIVTTTPVELISIDFLTIEVKGKKKTSSSSWITSRSSHKRSAQRTSPQRQSQRLCGTTFSLYMGSLNGSYRTKGVTSESKLIKELCTMLGIDKCRTTPYHPSGNPVERWNRTLIGMLRSLSDSQKLDWRKHPKSCVHAYNACIHQSTGYSPYYLFFRRHPKLPIDLAFGIDLEKKSKGTPRDYIQGLKRSLQAAYKSASNNMAKTADSNKRRYDMQLMYMQLFWSRGIAVLLEKWARGSLPRSMTDGRRTSMSWTPG